MTIQEESKKIKESLAEEQQDKLKIALFGQPGAGKSSIINKLVGKNVAEIGASTDVTKEAKIHEYNELLLVDLPGYGTSQFPPNEWMESFKPEEFDLFLCVFSGKFHDSDTTFFKELKSKGRVCLFVRNKYDDIWDPAKSTEELQEEILEDVQKQVGSQEKVYFTSCRNSFGFDLLQEGIRNVLEPAKKDKYIRAAKAYTIKHLEQKRQECEGLVTRYAGLAAANGINPVPGLDVGVDVSLMLKMFKEIREIYGIEHKKFKNLGPALLPVANKVIDYATKEGALLLLKHYATRISVSKLSKYVPIVGQAIAATVGFAITKSAGDAYLKDCHTLAEAILKEELNTYDSVSL
ncbi:GTPase [Virgibacillus sp. DJP39]|uniref:GTPase n=1 Tax=Virgibacillus sp. DJP39 TaxID=3409790 RepID=UPI003BB73FE6